MCALQWKIMTWCHHYHITLKARHIPGCLNVMADLLSRLNQVQSTEWSLHLQVFKQICQKWFTPHVDLFATHLNHKLPLYVSPVPDPKAWDIDALNLNWMGLTAYAYTPTALLHRVIQKFRQCHYLIIVIAPGWPGIPWFWDLVQLSTSAGVQTDLSKVVHSPCRSICHSPEPQTSTVRISCPRPKGLGHRCSELKLDGSHCLCLHSNGSPSQGDPKIQAMSLPDHRNSPRLARDTLVLGPSAALNRDPTATSDVNNSPQIIPELCVSQQPTTSQPPRLVSRSGQLQEQGFSVEVAERIAAPQRSSTRTIYKSKWALFEKWCRENSLDFSTPSVKQISDFFMYLYQDLTPLYH